MTKANKKSEKVIKLKKRVCNLLFEKDENNKNRCIDVVVRAANCFIKLTVDTGSPSSFINKATADKLLADPSTKASFTPVNKMKNYVRHICYNKKQIDILGEVSLRVISRLGGRRM